MSDWSEIEKGIPFPVADLFILMTKCQEKIIYSISTEENAPIFFWKRKNKSYLVVFIGV